MSELWSRAGGAVPTACMNFARALSTGRHHIDERAVNSAYLACEGLFLDFLEGQRRIEKAGVSPKTIADLRAGRTPTKAPKDERALYDFIQEMHKKRRVSDRTYKKAHAVLGDTAMVEFAGLIGCYTLVSLVLNTFNVPIPAGEPLPFAEPSV